MHTTMLHVTHSFNEAFLLGSRMAVMNKGEIIQVGEPEDGVPQLGDAALPSSSRLTVAPKESGKVNIRVRMGMTRIHCVSADASR